MKIPTLTLALAAACSPTTKQAMPEATGPTVPALAAAPAAPAQTVVLRWSSNGDAMGFDDVVRHRLATAHLDGAGAVFRGTTLEVDVPNATRERLAIARRAVDAPYDVHFADAAGTILRLDRATLVDGHMAYDPATNRPQVVVEVTPAAAPRLAELTTHAPVDLVVDGDVAVSHAIVDAPITKGRVAITMGASDPSQAEAEAGRIANALHATLHGPLTYQPGS